MDGQEYERRSDERRTSEKVAMLDERTLQITKTLADVAVRFDNALTKQEAMLTKYATDTAQAIQAHTLEEKEMWRDFKESNENSHSEIKEEFNNRVEPLETRITTLEKVIWRWGGGLTLLLIILSNLDTILKMLGK